MPRRPIVIRVRRDKKWWKVFRADFPLLRQFVGPFSVDPGNESVQFNDTTLQILETELTPYKVSFAKRGGDVTLPVTYHITTLADFRLADIRISGWCLLSDGDIVQPSWHASTWQRSRTMRRPKVLKTMCGKIVEGDPAHAWGTPTCDVCREHLRAEAKE